MPNMQCNVDCDYEYYYWFFFSSCSTPVDLAICNIGHFRKAGDNLARFMNCCKVATS